MQGTKKQKHSRRTAVSFQRTIFFRKEAAARSNWETADGTHHLEAPGIGSFSAVAVFSNRFFFRVSFNGMYVIFFFFKNNAETTIKS